MACFTCHHHKYATFDFPSAEPKRPASPDETQTFSPRESNKFLIPPCCLLPCRPCTRPFQSGWLSFAPMKPPALIFPSSPLGSGGPQKCLNATSWGKACCLATWKSRPFNKRREKGASFLVLSNCFLERVGVFDAFKKPFPFLLHFSSYSILYPHFTLSPKFG